MLKLSCLNARQLLQPFPLVDPLLSAYLCHESLLMTQRAHGLLHEHPQKDRVWHVFLQRVVEDVLRDAVRVLETVLELGVKNALAHDHPRQKRG